MKKYTSIQTWLSSNPSEKELQKILNSINKTDERDINKKIRLVKSHIKKMDILFESIANTIQVCEQLSYVQFLGATAKFKKELTLLIRDIKNKTHLIQSHVNKLNELWT